jgi:hypothetical protein
MAQETAPNQAAESPSPGPGPTSSAGESPFDAHEQAGGDPFVEHPELFVGGAFVGGLLLAQILKRVRR